MTKSNVVFDTFCDEINPILGEPADDPNSTASSDLSLSVSKKEEPREEPEVIKKWKENQVNLVKIQFNTHQRASPKKTSPEEGTPEEGG